jgi:hypothetical protein
MKYDDLTDEGKQDYVDAVNVRWGQLHALSKEHAEGGIKYLFTTNAGGAVAVLTYLGATAGSDESSSAIKWALGVFFLGIVLVGCLKLYLVHYAEDLFSHYQQETDKYFDGQIDWNELSDSDKEKVGNNKIGFNLGYGSFSCFIVGCLLGGWGVL